MNGERVRGPAPWGRGRSGLAAAGGCSCLWQGCGVCPRLSFAARGRCGPSQSVLQSRIYFRPKWGVGGGPSPTPSERMSRARRSTRTGVAGRPLAHGVCSSRGGGGVACPTAGRFQRILGEMFGARRCDRHANLPSADGERQSLYFEHTMCTDRDLVAGVARARLPYAANMVSGVDSAGCACGAGPGVAEAAAGLADMRCEGRGNFD
jgi:hypothetical protein